MSSAFTPLASHASCGGTVCASRRGIPGELSVDASLRSKSGRVSTYPSEGGDLAVVCRVAGHLDIRVRYSRREDQRASKAYASTILTLIVLPVQAPEVSPSSEPVPTDE